MPTPKRHHYLPVSYLCRFARERSERGALHVFDLVNRQPRVQTPKNTGVQGYYNAIEKQDGTRDFGIEQFFSRIESQVSPVIDRLEGGGTLTEEERGILGLFVACQKLRGPEFEEQPRQTMDQILRLSARLCFADADRAHESLAQFERDTGAPLGLSAEEMMAYIQRDDYQIRIHRNESLRLMTRLVGDMAKRFVRMDWQFLHTSRKCAFITTDNPVYVMPPVDWRNMPKWCGYGYGTPGTRKLFPLSDRLCLMMLDPGVRAEHASIGDEDVRTINLHLATEAYRLVIARDQHLLDSLVRAVSRAERRKGFKWGGLPVDRQRSH